MQPTFLHNRYYSEGYPSLSIVIDANGNASVESGEGLQTINLSGLSPQDLQGIIDRLQAIQVLAQRQQNQAEQQ